MVLEELMTENFAELIKYTNPKIKKKKTLIKILSRVNMTSYLDILQ